MYMQSVDMARDLLTQGNKAVSNYGNYAYFNINIRN